MTVKEAANKLSLEEKEIRKRRKDGMIIGLKKLPNGRLFIPEDTKIIPSKIEVKSFILQILKFKNDMNYIISRELCADNDSLNDLISYLYKRGFIGQVGFYNNIMELFSIIKVTEKGFDYVTGGKIKTDSEPPKTYSLFSLKIDSINGFKVG
ncbi:MAG: hypothetical protein MJ147_08080 [Clostridia bacterium]|nr:hypothetical protein [Clostridia bacterium]